MNMMDLVGRCGLYCGACVIYRAQRDDQSLRAKIAHRYNCSTDEVRCNGCGALTPGCWGNGCKIFQCTIDMGVNFCFERKKLETCGIFNNLAKGYLEDGVDLRKNLQKIKEGKVKEWLTESQKKYTCKECNKPLAYSSKCHHCGAQII
ncbi:MAG: DUF3795 domain-containing protein [Clostridiaceae bacterium]|nr:DUF3795 domain-containing protein [Clostridiaceae bacterium]